MMKYFNPTLEVKNIDYKHASLKIFPNPAQSHFTLMYTSDKNTTAALEVFDISGSLVFAQEVLLKTGTNFIPLEARQWMPGNYIFTLKVKNKILSEGRLIKIK